VVPVQFGATRTVSLFDADDRAIEAGECVVIEGDRGPVVGVAVASSARQMVSKVPRRLIGRLTGKDKSHAVRNADRETEAYTFCRKQIDRHRLPMKLARVEYLHNGSKALFYFSADSRVDFRDLVRDLARRLRVRVEMRQVGVRDEAKVSGGLGPCGRELCCSSWINEFQSVSIRMAKDQGLVLNPGKVSGMCGRLKCCLAYEQRLYQEARKQLPKVGQTVRTKDGEGRVQELDIPRKLVLVSSADGTSTKYTAAEVSVVPRGPQNKGAPRQPRRDQGRGGTPDEPAR
jgi:cell fate regulator YaaT (PSP1 superfamily)